MNSKTSAKLFGTDGIRGKAGIFPLDSDSVRTIGSSLTRHLSERTKHHAPRLIVGRDTRESGAEIERDLIAGVVSAGGEIESAGVITTPGVAYLTRTLPADAGVVISASHNPYEDNGIKVFEPSGRKLDDQMERQIERDIHEASNGPDPGPTADSPNHHQRETELVQRYINFLQHEVAKDLPLAGQRIVMDCANGAAFEIAPRLFTSLGADVIAINNQPNGRNINLNCGSLHIDALQQRVIAESAAVGVAFDGDADRALFVDADGNFVDGDATLWVLANYMQSRGQLPDDLVVATSMTNLGLEVALRSRGIKLTRTDVGDKYVLDELLRSQAALGGEQSGHIIFPGISLAGDGLITAIALLRVMCDENKSLADLTRGFTRFPQILLNVRVREKVPFADLPSVHSLAARIESAMGERGRLLLRYSGTERLARVMIEGEDKGEVETHAQALADLIQAEIGVPEA